FSRDWSSDVCSSDLVAFQPFGMPLDCQEKRAVLRLQRFHHSIPAPGRDDQSRGWFLYRLVVKGVRPNPLPFYYSRQEGSFLHPHPVADLFRRRLLPVGDPELCREILVQTAAKRHIDNLQPSADPKDRNGVTKSPPDQEDLPGVPVPAHTVQGKEFLLPV